MYEVRLPQLVRAPGYVHHLYQQRWVISKVDLLANINVPHVLTVFMGWRDMFVEYTLHGHTITPVSSFAERRNWDMQVHVILMQVHVILMLHFLLFSFSLAHLTNGKIAAIITVLYSQRYVYNKSKQNLFHTLKCLVELMFDENKTFGFFNSLLSQFPSDIHRSCTHTLRETSLVHIVISVSEPNKISSKTTYISYYIYFLSCLTNLSRLICRKSRRSHQTRLCSRTLRTLRLFGQ